MELALSALNDDDPQKKEGLLLLEKAKSFKSDPVKALLSEAEQIMEPDQKEKLELAVKIYETYKSGGSMDSMVPEEYKGYYNHANVALEKAKELKAKKDEMQLAIITKAVNPIWSKKDTEGLGHITKVQCMELV